MIVDGIDMASEARWSSKFGRDQLTAYVDHKATHSAFFDEEEAAEHIVDFYGLIGKRIFREDEQGFCWLEKYHDAATARIEFDNQTAWLNEPEYRLTDTNPLAPRYFEGREDDLREWMGDNGYLAPAAYYYMPISEVIEQVIEANGGEVSIEVIR